MNDKIKKHILKVFNHYLEAIENAKISKEVGLNARNPNFPSEISEYIVKHSLCKYWDLDKDDIIKPKDGDLMLVSDKRKIEVKCFSSNGPISFGPIEKWNFLILVDARKCNINEFKIYEIPFANTTNVIKNIPVSKTENFDDQAKQKRRPRIRPNELLSYLNDKVKLIKEGTLEKLLNIKK